MKKIFLLAFILWGVTSFGQRQVLGMLKNNLSSDPSSPVLIIFNGESNSGGYADNYLATSPEQDLRNIPIFNNSTRVFEGLHVGVNNLLIHDELSCCSFHSWELALANHYDDGDFGMHPVYILKTGQGGSMISEWETTDAYYDTMEVRIQEAYDLISAIHSGQSVQIFIWYTLGINDRVAGTSTSTWKAAVKTFFENVRATINTIVGSSVTVPILMTRFDSMFYNTVYETVIGEIETEVSFCHAISTIGAEVKVDGNHWQYLGWKDVIVPAFVTITLTYL